MPYSHSLDQVKGALLAQALFGEQNLEYNADRVRECNLLGQSNTRAQARSATDTLVIRNSKIRQTLFELNMNNGDFRETARDRSSNIVTNSYRLNGFEHVDAFGLQSSVRVIGNSQDNTVLGGFNADFMEGGAGVDALTGDRGNDWIFGGDGNDKIDGGDDDDILIGGSGVDDIYGGSGRDTFVLTSSGGDKIHDFTPGDDRLLVSSANGIYGASIQADRQGALIRNGDGTLLACLYGVDASMLTIQGQTIV